jgi:hypothetical protein
MGGDRGTENVGGTIRPVMWWAVGWEPSKTFLKKVTRVKRGLLKEWLGVAVTQSNPAVEAEVGMLRAEDEVMVGKLKLWGRLWRSESKVVGRLRQGSRLWKWIRTMQEEWGLARVEGEVGEWNAEIKRVVERVAKDRWRKEVVKMNKLGLWREMDSGWGKKWWITERPEGWRSMVKMRMEDGLLIETGRYRPKIPREKRVCVMCGGGVEDAWHLMGECRWLETERKELWETMSWKLNVWWNVEMVQKHRVGLNALGGRSLLVAAMEEMGGRNLVKVWLGGRIGVGVKEKEREILYKEVAKFCKQAFDKRREVVESGRGSETAARVMIW